MRSRTVMKRTVRTTLIISILLAGAFSCRQACAAPIQWIYSYEDSLKAASREGKPVMAFLYTNWCGYCRKLEAETFTDGAVETESRGFVCAKIDLEKRRDLAYRYGASAVPVILFLDQSGRVIWREFGFRDAPTLSGRMRQVLAFFTKSHAANLSIDQAFEAARLGRFDEAIAIIDKAIALYPDDARLYAARSVFVRYKGDLDAAIRDLDTSLAKNPSDDTVWIMRGMANYEKRDPEKAMADFNKAIALNRLAYEAYAGRGIILLDQRDLNGAIKNLNSALIINPRYAAGYLYRGTMYLVAGELDKAIADLTNAIRLEPDLTNAYSNRAAAYMYSKQYDKSWEDVRTLERRGRSMSPEFMAELRRLSGRER